MFMKTMKYAIAMFASVLALSTSVWANPDVEMSYIHEDIQEARPFSLNNETLSRSVWTPDMRLPNRPLTRSELDLWIIQHCNQGGVTNFEREVLRLTNILREEVGAPPLVLDYGLSRAARFKSQEKVDLQYSGHQSPVYGAWTTIPSMFLNHNLAGVSIGENLIAIMNEQMHNLTPHIFVNAWYSSPGHRRNMLDPHFTTMGVGVVMEPPSGNAGRINAGATQMFGRGLPQQPSCICVGGDCEGHVRATSWASLRAAIENSPTNATFTTFIEIPDGLVIRPLPGDTDITIELGRNITLIGGGTIDRGLADGAAIPNGNVFWVNSPSAAHRSVLTLDGPTITGGNTSTANSAGGIAVSNNSTLIINSGVITNNRATAGTSSGGVSAVTAAGRIYMNGGIITNNPAGGGVIISGPLNRFIMNGGEISNNSRLNFGGGVFVGANTNFIMFDGLITGNTATLGGGGVHAGSGTFTMHGGTITNNNAPEGGGVRVAVATASFHLNPNVGDSGVVANNTPHNVFPTNAPVITSVNNFTTTRYGSFRVVAFGYPLPTFSLVGQPAGVSIDAVTGEISISQNALTGSSTFSINATNINGTTTQEFTLNLTAPDMIPPSFFHSPVSQMANEGDSVQFSAYVIDGYPLATLQWQVSTNDGSSWSNVSGQTSDTMTITATPAHNNNLFRLVAQNAVGSVNSSSALLTVYYEPPVDNKLALREIIANAEALDVSNYVASSVNRLNTVLNSARIVYNNSNATQAQIDNAVSNLQSQINGLVVIPPPLDRSALGAVISSAESLDVSNYVASSVNRLNVALNSAKNVYNNSSATQAQIDSAINSLQSQINGLVVVVVPPSLDRSALGAIIADAESRNPSDYTSWARVNIALNSARNIYNNTNATQAQIDNATNNLATQLGGLILAAR